MSKTPLIQVLERALDFLGTVPGPIARAAQRSRTAEEDELIVPIIQFANGDLSKRDEAIAIHRRLEMIRPYLSVHPAQRFMCEVDTCAPLVDAREEARARLLVLARDRVPAAAETRHAR